MIEMRWIKRTVSSVHGGEQKTFLQYRYLGRDLVFVGRDGLISAEGITLEGYGYPWSEWQDVPEGESNE